MASSSSSSQFGGAVAAAAVAAAADIATNNNSPTAILQQQHFVAASNQLTELDEIRLLNFPAQSEELGTAIPLTFIFGLLLVTGVLGNLCTAIVIARPKNKYMHTATNYYLFSLAMSDLLFLLLGLPNEMYNLWHKYPYEFGEFVCIARGFLSEATTNASILTIVAFTVERYVAICYPFYAHSMSKLPRAVTSIIGIWLLAALCAIPPAAELGIVKQVSSFTNRTIELTAQCATARTIYANMFEISAICFFLIPMVVVTVLYIFIAVELHSSGSSAAVQQSLKSSKSSKKCNFPSLSSLQKQTNHNNNNNNNNNSTTTTTTTTTQTTATTATTAIATSSSAQVAQQKQRSVIQMLDCLTQPEIVAVVVSFFICWLPFHAQRLLASYLVKTKSTNVFLNETYLKLTYVSGVMYYLSSTMNPILYQLMSAKFRLAFKETFNCSPLSCLKLYAGGSSFASGAPPASMLSGGGGGSAANCPNAAAAAAAKTKRLATANSSYFSFHHHASVPLQRPASAKAGATALFSFDEVPAAEEVRKSQSLRHTKHEPVSCGGVVDKSADSKLQQQQQSPLAAAAKQSLLPKQLRINQNESGFVSEICLSSELQQPNKQLNGEPKQATASKQVVPVVLISEVMFDANNSRS